MRKKPLCCLFVGSSLKGLEILASFAFLLDLPLIVTDSFIEELCSQHFADLKVSIIENADLASYVSTHYQVAVTNLYPAESSALFSFTKSFNKKTFATFSLLDRCDLLDRKQMVGNISLLMDSTFFASSLLSDCKSEGLKEIIEIGNVKFLYFKNNEKAQKKAVHQRFKRIPSHAKKILHIFGANSPKDYLYNVAKDLPEEWHLFIKVEEEIEKEEDLHFLAKIKKSKRIHLVHEMPLTYAFFDFCDAYILNTNAAALPCLYFKKPTFFFEGKETPYHPLQKMGAILDPTKNINLFSWIDNYFSFDVHDRKLTQDKLISVFYKTELDYSLVKKQIEKSLTVLKDQEFPL